MNEERRETIDTERPASSPGDFLLVPKVEYDLPKGRVGAGDAVIDGRALRNVDRIIDLLDVVDEPPAMEEVALGGSVPKAAERIFDLTDIVEDPSIAESHEGQDIIVIDGRVYERVTRPRSVKLETAVLLEHPPRIDNGLHDEIMKAVIKIAEGIVRDAVPDIAERVVREEIEKLKAENQLS